MPRALNDILTELDTVYNPQRQRARDLYSSELPFMDEQLKIQEGGQQQALQEFNKSAEEKANRRGMFFSGIPIEQQARYFGSDFMPAMQGLKNRYATQRNSLYQTMLETISGLDAEQRKQALGMRDQEQAREDEQARLAEEKRRWEAEMAAAAAARSSGGGDSGFNLTRTDGGQFGGENGYSMEKRADGGFNFYAPDGRNISAANFAANTSYADDFRSLLELMAQNGDTGARQALGFVGNDYGYDPTKVLEQGDANLYNALTWGTAAPTASAYRAPTQRSSVPNYKTNTGYVSQRW